MANTDAAFGLRPVRHLNGNPYNGAYNEYPIPSGYSTDLLPGDPVKLVAAGISWQRVEDELDRRALKIRRRGGDRKDRA